MTGMNSWPAARRQDHRGGPYGHRTRHHADRREGSPGWLEETVTLDRLGLFPQMGRSLKTTNGLESLNSLVEQRVGKVDQWRTSDQKRRWLAAALLDIESRLRRIRGFRALPLLQQVLLTAVRGGEATAAIQAA